MKKFIKETAFLILFVCIGWIVGYHIGGAVYEYMTPLETAEI